MKKNLKMPLFIIVILTVLLLSRDWLEIKALKRISSVPVIGDQLIQCIYPVTEKFWVHRSNSLEKTVDFADKYHGIEMDIIFFNEQNLFDVSHDSNGRIDYPLNDFLSFLGTKQTNIWLDFKNLDNENMIQSSKSLSKLLQDANINKSRIVVESQNYDALGNFKRQNYYTSFYCPTYKYNLETDNGKTMFIAEVLKAVESGNIDALSFPIEYYPLMKSIQTKVDLLTWNPGDKWFSFYLKPDLKAILDDPQVKVILIKDRGRINR